MIPDRNNTTKETPHENTDQSWRHARHHRRVRAGDRYGGRRSLRQVLQEYVQRLRQVR
jgi:hypothetical protein